MRRKALYTWLVTALFCMAFLPHVVAHAATNNGGDLLAPMTGPNFTQYPLNNYSLTYVPTNQGGLVDIKDNIYETINWGLNVVWQMYLLGVDNVIRLVQWAFNLQIVQILTGSLAFAIDAIRRAIWEPIWYFMSAIAVAWMIYYWVSGRVQKMWGTVFTTIAIIGIAGAVFSNMPALLNGANEASAQVSTQVLDTMSSGMNQGSTDGQSALDTVSSALWTALAKDPYLMLEFGNIKDGKKNFNTIMPMDDQQRQNWFNNQTTEQGLGSRLSTPKYSITTSIGLGTRATDLVVIFIVGLVFSVMLAYYAFQLVWWQFVALARGMMAASFLLVSLWPEHGLREVGKWAFSCIEAFVYKVVMTIALGSILVMYMGITNAMSQLGWLPTLLMQIAMIIAVWTTIKELKGKALGLPLPSGHVLGGGGPTPGAEEGQKSLRVGTALAGAMATGSITAGAISLGRPEFLRRGFAQYLAQKRRDGLNTRESMAQMTERGLDPASAEDRHTFAEMLRDEGQPGKQQGKLLNSLPTQPASALKTPKLMPNLNSDAQRVWRNMSRSGVNPALASESSIREWIRKHPEDEPHMEAVQRFASLPVSETVVNPPNKSSGYYIPPENPGREHPEYAYWDKNYKEDRMIYEQVKQRVDAKARLEHDQAVNVYRAQPFYRRIRAGKPVYQAPTAAQYVKAFHEIRNRPRPIVVNKPSKGEPSHESR
ncbi:hypothetical protein [Alicyclobacillus fodiniaquatilis]|uniref:TrbL/VirB6 plasmid conjugal transfer protein n=1 Tax=Alicyclobacillus fodiniaquatilis TaxID=1661150 RepID=A0ABW4JK68_9BACL